jgi:hypothetical protein
VAGASSQPHVDSGQGWRGRAVKVKGGDEAGARGELEAEARKEPEEEGRLRPTSVWGQTAVWEEECKEDDASNVT